MRPTQPPPANRRRRRRPDLSLPLPQRDPSVVVPMPLPPTSISAPTSSHQFSFYELDRVKRIGSGSSGTIYKVIHRPTNRLFALKVIHGNHHEDSVRRQILREFQILRDMNHPNVVKCHEIFDHEGVIQVLLEFMDGGSLQGIKTADECQLSDFARQILSGLSYMHRRHIVHRDIKPSNILINSLKNVRIADFGVSTILAQTMDPFNSSAGKMAYLSPERINTDSNHGQCDGYAGDIWSFGVTILEFYLGRFPFAVGREGDWASLISVICMSQPPEAPPSASREFRDFIACCLQRDPRRRWTAAQLLQHPFILRSSAGGGQVPSHVMPGISKHEEVPSTPQCAVSGMGQACSRVDVRWIYQILVRMPYKVEVRKMRDMLETMRHGDHAFRKLDFKTAIDCYSQFIDVAEVSPVIFARRSLCYLFCDQPDDALRDAMRAQFIYLEWPTAFYLQSAALAKLGMHKDASDLLNEAARLEETSQQEVLKGVSEVEKQSETYETRTEFMPQNQSGKGKISAVGGRGKPDMMQPQEEESDALHVGSAGNQMIPEASGQQGRKATSQGIETEIVQIQEMREQSFSSSALEQSGMPTEISLEATIQNGMINLSGGRCDIRIDRTLNTIVECIKSSDIGKIGVYGRAGVGKTTVLEALKDLPEIRSMFDHVIWVTIPKTWNPIEVQTLIARQLSCSEIDDMHKDTARFVSLLEPIKFLLILDDVDEHINLEMAGIPKPTPENGSKIVLTTRWQQVCEIMAVDAIIRLENLLSWELFCQSVGEVVDSFNIQPIAKQLVEMCCHYSHAIILMAGALKDVSDVDVWKNALEWLSRQPASYGENLENLLIDVLKFSCEHLADDTTKKCLRYCAHHCEKEEIAIESLIHQWIADGLVDTHLEGNRILQNLINANLLESVKGGVFVKLQSIDRHILVNSIIQPEEGKLFLMLGGLGLTELPKEEEWENAKEIHLMHNELCELPEILRCPMLSALFLQRNYKLRLIPPSFFDYMPVLQVLNLSSTRIRSLPESLFRLVSLKRFFLNDCRNFMMLSPKIGELKQLEVLDLEGTEIMDLPREMKNLTGLKCLEVSIYGHANDGRRVKQSNAMVHSGIISALSEVEELNIDVNLDDERWDACAEAIVNEVCSLMKLSILKFYFPRVELLSHFEWNSTSMVYPLLSNFRFIVGHHINRIMTRLPRDVEFELERWDRCLKYVNGVGIPGEIKKVLRHATAFHLDRHTSVKKLSDFGVENMEQLKCCVVGECNELQVFIDGGDFYEEDYSEEIVPESYGDRGIGLQSLEYLYLYYMKNLRSIWEGPLHQRCLILLKSLTLQTCPMLTTIFMQESLDNLCSLEELTVEDCPAIISLFSCENPSESKSYCDLPKLKKISVHYLPELASICDCPLIAPKLEWVSFYNCPKLNKLPIDEEFNENLKNIKGEWSWWNALEWRSGRPKFLDDIFIPIDACD